ncbi:MAG: hypothetical protein R2798_00655 [Chitinophagales bacterium]|nr:hypothetical protein [Bacteroidota bacterium]MCB9044383.1 hypothetical protein [Chitinophagales bacterium]
MEEQEEILGVGSKVMHAYYGTGIIVENSLSDYSVYFKNRGAVDIPHADTRLQAITAKESPEQKLSLREVKNTLREVLRQFGDLVEDVPLGEKWNGGMLILQPANPQLKPKEIPIETFFHKIVMTRDRLRVMEQKINTSAIDDASKLELQQYITRIYGSLTTFNVLFADSEDYFKGTGGGG